MLKLALHATGLEGKDARDVSCQLDSIKASSFDSDVDNFCFRMELAAEDLTSNVLFIIQVVDMLPYHTDSGRFGGTSRDRGRQSLYMSIEDPLSGDLLRSTRNLKTGKTLIELNPRDSPQFDLCFANLVFDSSWSSLDVYELVTVSLNTKEQLALDKLDYLQGTYQTSQDIEQCTRRVISVINGNLFNELTALEIEHRDFNESTYDLCLSSFVVLAISLIASPILLTYYCIRYRKVMRTLSA